MFHTMVRIISKLKTNRKIKTQISAMFKGNIMDNCQLSKVSMNNVPPTLICVSFMVLWAWKRDKSMPDNFPFSFSFYEPKKGIKVYSIGVFFMVLRAWKGEKVSSSRENEWKWTKFHVWNKTYTNVTARWWRNKKFTRSSSSLHGVLQKESETMQIARGQA